MTQSWFRGSLALAVWFSAALAATTSLGEGNPLSVTVDEWGNGIGTLGPGNFIIDPTGGAPGTTVLIYDLPYRVTAGDVWIMDTDSVLPDPPLDQPLVQWGPVGDVIRFYNSGGTGHLIFYSDGSEPGVTGEPADVPLPPLDLAPVVFTVVENGPEGFNSAVFESLADNEPGYMTGGVTYTFVSDSAVPEPCSLVVWGLLGGAGFWCSQRRRARAR